MSKFENSAGKIKEYEEGIILSFFGDVPSLPKISFDGAKNEELFGNLFLDSLSTYGEDFIQAILFRYGKINPSGEKKLQIHCFALKKAIERGATLEAEDVEDDLLDKISGYFSNKEEVRVFFEKAFLYYYIKERFRPDRVTNDFLSDSLSGIGEKSSSITAMKTGYERNYR